MKSYCGLDNNDLTIPFLRLDEYCVAVFVAVDSRFAAIMLENKL